MFHRLDRDLSGLQSMLPTSLESIYLAFFTIIILLLSSQPMAFQNAVEQITIPSFSRRHIIMAAGNYTIGSTIILPSRITIEGIASALLC